MSKRHVEAAEVKVSDGDIVVDCPDGEQAVFTPEAALKTAQRLGDKAVEAIVERGRGGPDAGEPSTVRRSSEP